jgi:hypothetical protein
MEFQEDFLQTVWKYQYFDKTGLETTSGQRLAIHKIGKQNHYDGPDFLEALVQVGEMTYAGHIEIHKKASDWHAHEHGKDPRYEPVILHVVWEDDQTIQRSDGSAVPTLTLKGRILLDVLRNYERLVKNQQEILCAESLGSIPDIIRFSMLEKALVERLEQKGAALKSLLTQTNNDWEETTYRWLFQSFGFKTNSIPMRQLSEKIPYKLIQKHAGNPLQIEAMLLGQAGLIPEQAKDTYTEFIRDEYLFYRQKYSFPNGIHAHQWKYKGVRPSNFPGVRIAQLAQLLSQSPSLFSSFLNDTPDFSGLKKLLNIKVPDYWQRHFALGSPTSRPLSKSISSGSLQLLLINAVAPLWFVYGSYIEEASWKEKTFDLMNRLQAEENFVTRIYGKLNWLPLNAYDSQGMIGLYREYCQPKRCLECKIGQNILKSPG